MYVGQYVEVRDRSIILFKARGLIAAIRQDDRKVLIETFDGRKGYVEQTALKTA